MVFRLSQESSQSAERKLRLFHDRLVDLALSKLKSTSMIVAVTA